MKSDRLESQYLTSGGKGSFYFISADHIEYVFDFEKMFETKLSSPKFDSKLRRRPLTRAQAHDPR